MTHTTITSFLEAEDVVKADLTTAVKGGIPWIDLGDVHVAIRTIEQARALLTAADMILASFDATHATMVAKAIV